ncbi:hypothetical protein U2I54_25025 [Bacillus pseudomycoides]|uniref:Uncharacterized protein n=1 Tax=Bacillus bingmayongensis TaxID=1150157 RepID=A0ABU5K3G3_9BACI|nr:hypothetical protein [Bacillus pseudomycoides]
MKKVFSSNISTFVLIGFLLLLIDYNNLSTLEYIFIATSIMAFVAFLFNLATAYFLEKKEKECI